MSEANQRRLFMLFCLRCSDVLGTLSEDEIAFALRITTPELLESKTVFEARGFIDSKWNILHWEKRQFQSDSSTNRTRKYREKHRETSQERHGDGTEERRVEENRTDTEQNRVRTEAEAANRALLKKRAPMSNNGPVPLDSIFQSRQSTRRPLPSTRTELVVAGYVFSNLKPCNGCQRNIEWWTSPRGSPLPFDPMAEGAEMAVNHLETCPAASEYRKEAKR